MSSSSTRQNGPMPITLDDETTAALTLFNEYVAADRERTQREKRLRKAERAKDEAAALVKKLAKGGASKERSEAEAAYRAAAEKWKALRDGEEPPADTQDTRATKSAEPEAEADTETETRADSEADTETETETEAKAETRADSEADTETETEAKAETTEASADTEATESVVTETIDSSTKAEVEGGPAAEPETSADTEVESETKTKVDTETSAEHT